MAHPHAGAVIWRSLCAPGDRTNTIVRQQSVKYELNCENAVLEDLRIKVVEYLISKRLNTKLMKESI
jgi:hypothetical protein